MLKYKKYYVKKYTKTVLKIHHIVLKNFSGNNTQNVENKVLFLMLKKF